MYNSINSKIFRCKTNILLAKFSWKLQIIDERTQRKIKWYIQGLKDTTLFRYQFFSKFIYSFNANSIKVLTWVLDCNSLQRPECIGCASSLVHGGWLTLMKLPVKGVIITDGQAWKIAQVFNQEPDCSCFIKILYYFLSDFVIFIRK